MSKFAIAEVAMPSAGRGRGNRGTKYPFADLEVGQSFFCPEVEAKSIASTVSTANKRFATETGETRVNRRGNTVAALELTRKFEARSIADGAAWGHAGVPGAAVFRTM